MPTDLVLRLTGIDRHPGYPIVLMRAAFDAIRRGEVGVAESRAQAALNAERSLAVPPPYQHSLVETFYFVTAMSAAAAGNWSKAARGMLEEAEACRRQGAPPAMVATCLGGAVAFLSYGDQFGAALPLATEGLELARSSGNPTAIVINLNALAHSLADRAPDRTRALLSEALELQSTLGYENATELSIMALAAARIADWTLAARIAFRAIRYLHWVRGQLILAVILNVAARALSDIDPESSAMIDGAARTLALASSRNMSVETPRGNAGGSSACAAIQLDELMTRSVVVALGSCATEVPRWPRTMRSPTRWSTSASSSRAATANPSASPRPLQVQLGQMRPVLGSTRRLHFRLLWAAQLLLDALGQRCSGVAHVTFGSHPRTSTVSTAVRGQQIPRYPRASRHPAYTW